MSMKDFMFLYRTNYAAIPFDSEEKLKAMTKKWMDWFASTGVQNNLIDMGKRLEPSGKVVKESNVVTNGPYTEIKESIGGYSVVKADSYDAAVEMAKGCPILTIGGNVEVREISVL